MRSKRGFGTVLSWRVAFGHSPSSSPRASRWPLLDRRAGATPGVARAGREGVHRRAPREPFALHPTARSRDRRPRNLRLDRALYGRRARRRQRPARHRGDARLPDDRGARRMGRQGGAAGRAGTFRPERGADRHDGFLLLPRDEWAARSQDLRACFRQRARRRRLSPRRRAQDHRCARLDSRRRAVAGFLARRPRRRLREFHDRARSGLQRVSLQPHPCRLSDARRWRPALLQGRRRRRAAPGRRPHRPTHRRARRSKTWPRARCRQIAKAVAVSMPARRRPTPTPGRATRPHTRRCPAHGTKLQKARPTTGTSPPRSLGASASRSPAPDCRPPWRRRARRG